MYGPALPGGVVEVDQTLIMIPENYQAERASNPLSDYVPGSEIQDNPYYQELSGTDRQGNLGASHDNLL